MAFSLPGTRNGRNRLEGNAVSPVLAALKNRSQFIPENSGQIKSLSKKLIARHHGGDIFLNGADGLDVEVFHQDIGHIGGKETGKGGPEADALHTQ